MRDARRRFRLRPKVSGWQELRRALRSGIGARRMRVAEVKTDSNISHGIVVANTDTGQPGQRTQVSRTGKEVWQNQVDYGVRMGGVEVGKQAAMRQI